MLCKMLLSLYFTIPPLTPCSRILLQKLIVAQLPKKFPVCYEKRTSIVVITRVRTGPHPELYRSRPQSTHFVTLPSTNNFQIAPFPLQVCVLNFLSLFSLVLQAFACPSILILLHWGALTISNATY